MAKPTRTPPPPRQRDVSWLLLLAFFGSGATSLVFEVVWSKVLSYLLSVDLYASATVVTAYMAGIGLGSAISGRLPGVWRRSPRTYALLQVVIGLFGLASIPILYAMQPLLASMHGLAFTSAPLFLLIRFLLVFGVLLAPAILMGMTLPILAAVGGDRVAGSFARWAGLLYGVNTVGAVAGTLAAGFALIPALGLRGTCMVAGVVDLGIGGAIWLAYRAESKTALPAAVPPVPETGSAPERLRRAIWPPQAVGFSFLLSGLSALILEMVWFRLLSQILGPSVHAFAVMLAVYLLGIGVGSLVAASVVPRVSRPRVSLGLGLAVVALILLGTQFYLNRLPFLYAWFFLRLSAETFAVTHLLTQGAIAALMILPVTLGLGFIFPLATRASRTEAGETPVGGLLALNTAGGVAGCLLAGFELVPWLGVFGTLRIAGALLFVPAAWLLLTGEREQWRRWRVALPGTAGGFLLLLLLSPGPDAAVLTGGVYAEMLNRDAFRARLGRGDTPVFGGDVLFLQEGLNNVVAVVANRYGDGNLTLHLSGHWEATTDLLGRIHLHMLGHLPMLFARRAETAAVIGLGTGTTTGSLLRHPTLRRVDVAEIEPAVVAAERLYHFVNNRPLADPRTRLILMDGRSLLAYREQAYDVITVDPIHPFVAGSGNLYSDEFYRIVRRRLNPGGVFCQWLPLGAVSPAALDTMLATLRSVFPHLAVFTFFNEGIVLASVEPLQRPWQEFGARFAAPTVRKDFARMDIRTPFNLVAFLAGAEQQIVAYLGGYDHRNTDDNVWLEHRLARDIFDRHLPNMAKRLDERLQTGDHTVLAQLLPGIPLDTLQRELASLTRHTEEHFQRALTAEAGRQIAAMEAELRAVLEDPVSPRYYEAGLKLSRQYATTGRREETLKILHCLQRRFPALAEPYVFEAEVELQAGRVDAAYQALGRGLRYSPRDPRLREAPAKT